MKIKKVLSFLLILSFLSGQSWAYWVWSPEAGKFVNTETGAQDDADDQYEYALKLYKEKNLDQAAEQFEDILKKSPNARVAAEAQYRLGIIYEEKDDPYKAFKAYRHLIDTYPQSERFNEVVEREFELGSTFQSGKKGKVLGVEILPALPRAVEVFEHIVKQAPYSTYGDKAQFQLGLTYKKMGQFGKAAEAFQGILDQYPQSPLLSQARYELAETSFLRSSSEYRDQRALDEASSQVNKFLKTYPDSEESERAVKIRQEIDEKNAEKNYRIGAYYENQNYLESALIYYEDVSKRYPATKWGQKAASKLESLKDPAKYIGGQQKEVNEKIQVLESQLKSGSIKDDTEKGSVERELERMQSKRKGVEKDKKESLKRRHDDLKRRERELNEKVKNLNKKRKLLEKNPSDDLTRAIERWNASLMEERDALDKEKSQVKGWHEELGVKESKSPVDFLPFMGSGPTELEKIRGIEAKKLYKVSEEKKSVLEQKETLYKQYGEVSTLLGQIDPDGLNQLMASPEAAKAEEANPDLKAQKEKLQNLQAESDRVEKELEEKKGAYQKKYGSSTWLSAIKSPSKIVGASSRAVANSVDFLNPFDSGENLENQDIQKLLERQMHLKEKISAQQSLVQTLAQAFDSELALQEQKRLLATLEEGEKTDPRQLRKDMKALERDIRARYQEIEDRHKRKKELLAQLEQALIQNETKTFGGKVLHTASSPVVGAARLGKAFLFGLPDKGVELTDSAEKMASRGGAEMEEIKRLEEEIRLQSIMIAAQDKEIVRLSRQLEILKAKASLAGGYKFRSSMVEVPYLFIGEAIDSAKKMLPAKKRQDILIGKLDEETKKLDEMKGELSRVESAIQKKGAAPDSQAVSETPATVPSDASASQTGTESAAEESLKKEIEVLAEQAKAKQQTYEIQKNKLADQYRSARVGGQAEGQKEWGKKQEKLRKELESIEKEIFDLIKDEQNLQKEETEVLEKRINHIDKLVPKIQSRVISQDLLHERDRMEERVSQLALRQDFLSKETERFQLPKKGEAHS